MEDKELQKRYLRKEVLIIDGSDMDGSYGLVIGVSSRSADPLTVLFESYGQVNHENYYKPEDVQLTGGQWHQGKQCDQSVRCRQNRFDGLWYMIDGKGQHGRGAGTQGIAWQEYLRELAANFRKEDHDTTREDPVGQVDD